ncbi:MAG: hypothetical protein AAFY82_04095 [Pseudomonadota bacterium]
MRVAQLRPLALACIFSGGVSIAQQEEPSAQPLGIESGSIYELSRQDVTLPIATNEQLEPNGSEGVSIPVETMINPMRCMAAWSYLASSTVRTPDETAEKHPDFTEAMASAHWQHWLKLDLAETQGVFSSDFHQRRLAAERQFATAMAEQGDGYAYRTLGACYVAPSERQIADPTLLLRNFMVEHQGLPENFAIPILQRQLRSFPITETIETGDSENCDLDATIFAEHARVTAVNQCFERGGILASMPKIQVADIEGICRVTSSIQCENIP